MISKIVSTALCLSAVLVSSAQKTPSFTLTSPDGAVTITVETGPAVQWSVKHGATTVLAPSPLSLTLQSGEVLGKKASVASSKKTSGNTTIPSPVYKKASISDHYHQLALTFKGGYSILFRAYNDGVAYRFVLPDKKEAVITAEEAVFNFTKDYTAFLPYVNDPRVKDDPFHSSFEALYSEGPISAMPKDAIAFLPVLVELEGGKKAVVTESDLSDYPGLYLRNPASKAGSLQATFARYPLELKAGGYNNMNSVVSRRAGYIAKVKGGSALPWRAIVISSQDKELLNNDMVYKLATPTPLKDLSWIRPGKVAWDWWNDWNISGVDFRAGINTATYKFYIDFAAANGIEYVVLDEGWSNSTDITRLNPAVDLPGLVRYGREKNVDLVLWATWYALDGRLDEVFGQYAKMGIKGFKIDFLDRDDQQMVASTYEIARKAADHKLIIDLHGMFKPAGLQRTWPNVVNFEGVKGLENAKWAPSDDVPRYDASIPFIRMVAGPMDYTPGAMRNASKAAFRAVHSSPMSQGTRAHQLAMYTLFESPLQMMADNPTAYMKEPESTAFIAKVPTVFDETVALDGQVGEYAAIARRKDDVWHVGALTNWTARELTVDFSFLPEGSYEAEIFSDGINADRDATDYKKEVKKVRKGDKLTVKMAPGGGWAARIYPGTGK
ncbi:MAG TPA: glycoside hydrolase family 97 protein [Chitinophagaceae bacterium]